MVEQATRRNLSTQELHGAVSLPWWEGQVWSHTLVVGLLKLERTEGCHCLVPQVGSLLDEQGLQCLVHQVPNCSCIEVEVHLKAAEEGEGGRPKARVVAVEHDSWTTSLLLMLLSMPACPKWNHPIGHSDTIGESSRGVVWVELLQVVGWTKRGGVGWQTKPSQQATNSVGPGVTCSVLWSWWHTVQHGLVAGWVGTWWSRLNGLVSVRPGGRILCFASRVVVIRCNRN